MRAREYVCDANTVEDEKHVVIECPAYHAEREIFKITYRGMWLILMMIYWQ
jgi:hypothetical protein